MVDVDYLNSILKERLSKINGHLKAHFVLISLFRRKLLGPVYFSDLSLGIKHFFHNNI